LKRTGKFHLKSKESFFGTKILFRYRLHNPASHNLGCWIDIYINQIREKESTEYTVLDLTQKKDTYTEIRAVDKRLIDNILSPLNSEDNMSILSQVQLTSQPWQPQF